MRSDTFESEGLTFQFLEWEAAPGAQTIILLHGFPQVASTWTAVAEALNAEGFRVIVPLQRGYSPRAIPHSIRRYSLENLANDIEALVAQLNAGRVHLVGHDWGGAVAWVFAATRPERLLSLTVASMPHPAALPRALLTTLQGIKSWYIPVLQVPGLIELLLRVFGKGFACTLLQRTGLSAALSHEYVDRLTTSDSTLKGAFNWYRAFLFDIRPVRRMRPIATSAVFIWSTGDIAVDGRAARLSSRHVVGSYRYIELKDVSHWIPENVPNRLADIVLKHVGTVSSPEVLRERSPGVSQAPS